MFLNFDETYELFWNIIDDTYIEIGVSCNTIGWCGLGISPSLVYTLINKYVLYIKLYYIVYIKHISSNIKV